MSPSQQKRLDEIINNKKDYAAWKKQLVGPTIDLILSLRKKLGKKTFASGFKKEDKGYLEAIEYIATGRKPQPKKK